MPENIRTILNKMFELIGEKPPKDDSYFKEPDWYLKHSWSGETQEEWRKWVEEFLKKNWKGVTNYRPTTKKMREKISYSLLLNYGFKVY